MNELAGVAGGRRERNKQRVRERIYEAAIELFAVNGYEATSVDEIADRADVARGTFFNHFQRKEDLIAAWVHQWRTKIVDAYTRERAAQSAKASVHETLSLYMTCIARETETQRHIAEFMLPAWVKAGSPLDDTPRTAEIFTQAIQDGIIQGEITANTDPALTGAMLRDLYLGALFRWIARPPRSGGLEAELVHVLNVVLRGIAIAQEPPSTIAAGRDQIR